METPNISNYTPDQIMVKERFKRVIPSTLLEENGRIGTDSYINGESRDPLVYEYMSQADFLREFDINSHPINSLKYYPNPLSKDEEGRLYNKIKTRIAIPYQQIIHTKRTDCLTGNNVNLRIVGSSTKDKDRKKSLEKLDTFREYWEYKNIENAIYEAICIDGKVGDAAVGYYMSGGEIGCRVFGYSKGDILYPHYDPLSGELALFGRKYFVCDKEGNQIAYLDVWDNRYYRRYVSRENEKKEEEWATDYEGPHNFPFVPIAYTRYGEPFWANSEDLINKFELAISQLAENNMAYALRILYSFGAEMEMSATINGTPTQISSPDPQAKVGFLEPADSSKSFELQLKVLDDNIYRGSFAVKTPELKSGSDLSSLTVKMLFADAFQKAQSDAKFYQKFLDTNVKLFKYGLGIELKDITGMEGFKVKAKLFPYVFLSETEEVANLMQLKSVGGLSKRTLTENAYEMGYGTIDEYDRILQEEHDALLGTEDTPIQSPSTGGNKAVRDNVVNNARAQQ